MFAVWKLKRAARRYATQLPHRLISDYGSHDHYTEPQIRAAVAHLGLDPHYICLAYARFLHEDEYNGLKPGLPLTWDYHQARAFFVEREPERLFSRYDPRTSGNRSGLGGQ